MARGATLHKDRGHRHKLSVGVEFVTVMRDRVFKTGLGVGRISASYLFSALRNVHRPFFTDILSSPLPIARLSPLSLSFFSSLFQLRLVFFGHERWVTGGIIHIRSFLSNFFLFLPLLFLLSATPIFLRRARGRVRRISGTGIFEIHCASVSFTRRRARLPFQWLFPLFPGGISEEIVRTIWFEVHLENSFPLLFRFFFFFFLFSLPSWFEIFFSSWVPPRCAFLRTDLGEMVYSRGFFRSRKRKFWIYTSNGIFF